ncbi:MAG: transposase, partial [Acidimicrobiales bacterium]
MKLQVYSVLAKEGVAVPMTDLFGVAGRALLASAKLAAAYAARVESLLDLIESFDRQVTIFERDVERELRDDAGYRAIQAIPGVGKTFAAIFVAEIGDATRFASPAQLCSWAGLTPR